MHGIVSGQAPPCKTFGAAICLIAAANHASSLPAHGRQRRVQGCRPDDDGFRHADRGLHSSRRRRRNGGDCSECVASGESVKPVDPARQIQKPSGIRTGGQPFHHASEPREGITHFKNAGECNHASTSAITAGKVNARTCYRSDGKQLAIGYAVKAIASPTSRRSHERRMNLGAKRTHAIHPHGERGLHRNTAVLKAPRIPSRLTANHSPTLSYFFQSIDPLDPASPARLSFRRPKSVTWA